MLMRFASMGHWAPASWAQGRSEIGGDVVDGVGTWEQVGWKLARVMYW